MVFPLVHGLDVIGWMFSGKQGLFDNIVKDLFVWWLDNVEIDLGLNGFHKISCLSYNINIVYNNKKVNNYF